MAEYTPACAEPSKKYPQGRTGTLAGAKVHRAAGDDPCPECLDARRQKNSEAAARYRERYPERGREASRRYGNQQKEMVYREKDKPCADCGIKYPPYVMQFDHLDPQVKNFTIGSGSSLRTERILEEISKCEVVCANCHAERTYQRHQARKEATTSAMDRACGGASPEAAPAGDSAS